MAGRMSAGGTSPQLWIEAFAILNIGFLTFDIYLAHSVNQFRNRAEYIPLFFSASRTVCCWCSVALLSGAAGAGFGRGSATSWAGRPFWSGLTGVILHLQSHFFYERTIAQPDLLGAVCRAARLHRAGISADHESHGGCRHRWNGRNGFCCSRWAAFIGNFVFSLADHAENGFFFPVEWVPVVASAIAVGFLAVPLIRRVSRLFIDVCAAVLVVEASVGLWGFVLHTMGNLQGPSVHAFDNFIYGAPPMAPLLFPNLMVLGVIGLWHLRNHEEYMRERAGSLAA